MLYKGRRNHQNNFYLYSLIYFFSRGSFAKEYFDYQLIVGLASCQTTVRCLGFRPQHAGGVWKRYFIFFLRFGLPSTPIPHESRTFRKRSSNQRNLKTSAFCFSVDGKRSSVVSNDVAIITVFPCPNQIQNVRLFLRFQNLPDSVDGKHLTSQSETSVLTYPFCVVSWRKASLKGFPSSPSKLRPFL